MAPSRKMPFPSMQDSDLDQESRSASEVDELEFSERKAKRRRISIDDEDEDSDKDLDASTSQRLQQQQQQHTAPSSIRKTTSQILQPTINTHTTLQTTTSTFSSLSISPWLIHSLASLSIRHPTPIQLTCIPPILSGRDCIGNSRTGTGKTIAFAVPILQTWALDPTGIYALILTPTRELALQIYEQFAALGAPQSLKCALITGGSEMRAQALALAARPHIVVATPGRLADHILTSGKETTVGLSRVKYVVLDEADRLLAAGPGSMLPDLGTCLSAVPPASERSTLLFTATVTPEVRALKDQPREKGRPEVFVAEISPTTTTSSTSTDLLPSSPSTSLTPLIPPSLRQTYLLIPPTHKPAFLHVLLLSLSPTNPTTSSSSQPPSIIIFTNTTTTATLLHHTLLSLSHPVTSLHSALPQRTRSANLASFRSRKSRILVATDVAGRGLDVPEVGVVVNYDVPRDPRDYVHRVGRTARMGSGGTGYGSRSAGDDGDGEVGVRGGLSITFVTGRDVELLLGIERYLSGGDSTSETSTSEAATAKTSETAQTAPSPSTSSARGTRAKAETNGEGKTPPPQFKMQLYSEPGVNLETRVIKGRTLKDVAEARMEALREMEKGGKGAAGGLRIGTKNKNRKR